jgi:two-component system response regulator MprA
MSNVTPPPDKRRLSNPEKLATSNGAVETAASPAQKKSPGGKRVLLVDDEPAVRLAVKQLLKFHGYDVTEAEGGAEGLKQYQAGKFDCVITDNLMPFMRGPELAARIRAIDPSQRIVLFTASADRLVHEKAPWDALLVKPFSAEELMAALSAPKHKT